MLNGHDDIGRARSALFALDAGGPRDEWVKLGMAAKAAGLDFDDFLAWSERAPNYVGETDCRCVWRSFDASGGIGAGTLFARAREAGWQDEGPRMNGHARAQEPRQASDKGSGSSFDFAAAWRDSEPATSAHAYVQRKLGLPAGLRVYHGPLRIAGQPIDGALLVPAFDTNGALQSWQAIPANEGKKLNAPGASMAGGRFIVGGPLREDAPCFIVEGVGAGWSAHQATGKPAAVCFGSGNVERVAVDLRKKHPKARLVIVADRGKEADSARVARTVGGAWIALPETWPANSDINDLHAADGLQAVENLLRKASAPAVNLPPLKTAADLLARDFEPIRWLIPGLLPEGLMMLVARPKVGKSWLALDVAIACATGGTVLGRRVERGAVLYLALEDSDRRMHSRLSKLGATGVGLGDLQYATDWPRGADGAAAIGDWIAAHPNARLVVIDVFAKLRATAEGRESAYSTDYADVASLKPPSDRAVSILLIHHTRKAESDDPIDSISGTLGIGGAADGAWIIKRARGADEAELHLIGRDLEEEGAFAVRFDRESCRWQWVGDAWRVRISSERREILDALAGGAARPAEIAKAIGKTEGAVRYLLHVMVRDGHVDRGIDGRYRAIDHAEEAA